MPRSDKGRPSLTIDYAASGVWTEATRPNINRALLCNTGTAEAKHIAISDLIVDSGARCRFADVNELPAGDTVAIEPIWYDRIAEERVQVQRGTLTQALSKAVVQAALRGRRQRKQWALCLEYEDLRGRRFLTLCEIQLVQLPLELGTVRLAEIEQPAG